jgi:hypothetical protein
MVCYKAVVSVLSRALECWLYPSTDFRDTHSRGLAGVAAEEFGESNRADDRFTFTLIASDRGS